MPHQGLPVYRKISAVAWVPFFYRQVVPDGTSGTEKVHAKHYFKKHIHYLFRHPLALTSR